MSTVSIIIPCYNEQATIGQLLEAIYAQTHPRTALEVVIADGFSTDETRAEIANFQAGHPDLRIKLVDNPRRNIPAALNQALAHAEGEVIVRLDGHSIPSPEYVERCVQALEEGRGAMVGGVWKIQPSGPGWLARSIAVVAAHPFGVGDARYRYATQPGPVDTVPFGAYRRELIERIGRYDETLLTNEDYEFNTRVRQSGGQVWLDPTIRSIYFARGDLAGLARQYWRYGYWKRRMLRRYPHTIRWRQALPPLFVLSLVGLALLALVWPLARWALAAELLLYWLVLTAAGAQAALKRQDLALVLGVPLGIATMHLCWGTAFLWSFFNRDS